MSEPKTFSFAVRLQRTVTEYAFVRVPATTALLRSDPESADGGVQIDGEKVMAAAVQIGEDPEIHWVRESSEIVPHPSQTPLPADYPLRPPVFPDNETPIHLQGDDQ